MSLTVYRDLEQRSPEWFAARCGMVTASVVGQLLTPTLKVASNDTSRGITAALVAERITEHVDQAYITNDMLRGILHEPIARARYAEVNEVDVDEVGFMVRDLEGGAELGASPDGLIGDIGGLEIKCPKPKSHIRTIVADEVPSYYMAQVQASLLVSGRAWWDFVSFSAGLPMWTKRVYPDPEWHEAITAAVIAFEEAAVAMTSEYLARSEGLPATDPIPDDLEVVI